ncbi:unnamed protein product [Schistosoma mattheei]|uniref:Uncharacterized protein n=1 Tax=Schistosoma mattheei TaxID=31246 RepID=A0A183Q1L4_9TREM|nr:unnamed protein product [Schistosoma mattheei]
MMNTPSGINYLKNGNNFLNSIYGSTNNSFIHSDQTIIDSYMKPNSPSKSVQHFYDFHEFNNPKRYFNVSNNYLLNNNNNNHSIEHRNSLTSIVKNVIMNVPNDNLCLLTTNDDNQLKNNINKWEIDCNYNLKDYHNKTDSIYNYKTTITNDHSKLLLINLIWDTIENQRRRRIYRLNLSIEILNRLYSLSY